MNSKQKEFNSIKLPKLKFKYVPTVMVSLELNMANQSNHKQYIIF